MAYDFRIKLNHSGQYIMPGSVVKLGRFEMESWRVDHGWYSWGGNRPVCGWYLQNMEDKSKLKPLQLPDLDDIYLIY